MTASSAAKCETCGRAPSMRGNVETVWHSYREPTEDFVRCPDPIHDRADACEAMRAALETCADVCEAEGKKLDHERETGHWSLKDERRARAESAYFCAHLVREHVKKSLPTPPPGDQKR